MRCVIYSRVSTDDQTVRNQIDQLRAFAAERQWKVVAEYSDVDSGRRATRCGLNAMMHAAGRREFDVLLYWSLDRLSREGVAATFRYFDQLNRWGVKWHDFTRPEMSGTGPMAEFFIACSAMWAALEADQISARTKAGLERARRQGKTLGRPRAVVDVCTLQKYSAAGMSYGAIARKVKLSRATVTRRLLQAAINVATVPDASNENPPVASEDAVHESVRGAKSDPVNVRVAAQLD